VLIRRFANDGLFLFSWYELLAQARMRKWLQGNIPDLILKARLIKNEYRNSRRSVVESSFVNRLSEVARCITRGGFPRLGFASRSIISRLVERQKAGPISSCELPNIFVLNTQVIAR
jgi:hypothetical protein